MGELFGDLIGGDTYLVMVLQHQLRFGQADRKLLAFARGKSRRTSGALASIGIGCSGDFSGITSSSSSGGNPGKARIPLSHYSSSDWKQIESKGSAISDEKTVFLCGFKTAGTTCIFPVRGVVE